MPKKICTISAMKSVVESVVDTGFDKEALQLMCLVQEEITTELEIEAELCRTVCNDKNTTPKHYRLASLMLGIGSIQK